MIARITVQDIYTIRDNPERREQLHEIAPHLKRLQPDVNQPNYCSDWDWTRQFEDVMINLEDEGARLLAAGFTFQVKAFKSNELIALKADVNKLEREYKVLRSMLYDPEVGTIVQVHLPNMKLLEINEVMVYADDCTNVLQGYLDQGWRILAVCPSIEQRRPDYILGRVKSV